MNVPIGAETIFHLGRLPVTNAYINSTIALVLIVMFAAVLRTRITKIPGTLQNATEAFLEFLLGYFDQVTQDREQSKKFLPLCGTLFVFILLSNWMGLFPGTGSIGRWIMHEGHLVFAPILRPANSDLNLTLAMAASSVIFSHLLGMFTLGFFVHWNKFIQIGSLGKALFTFKPMKIMVALIEFLVGLLELISEVAKVVSLSLRLFGNIFAGEVLITVISSLFAFILPLPFLALELIIGVIQATVFTLLTLVYLTVATSKPHGDEEEHAPSNGVAEAPAH